MTAPARACGPRAVRWRGPGGRTPGSDRGRGRTGDRRCLPRPRSRRPRSTASTRTARPAPAVGDVDVPGGGHSGVRRLDRHAHGAGRQAGVDAKGEAPLRARGAWSLVEDGPAAAAGVRLPRRGGHVGVAFGGRGEPEHGRRVPSLGFVDLSGASEIHQRALVAVNAERVAVLAGENDRALALDTARTSMRRARVAAASGARSPHT